MINWINDNMDRHIITIEDPIEYYHKHKKSLVNQREIGIDVPDFPEAIRRALRMDPDIILVGEMRDLATIQAADHRRRDRAHRLRHPAHQLGRRDRQPDHRRLPQGAAGPDPHPALGRDHRHPGPGAAAPQAEGAGRRLRDARRHPGHLEPDPREQDVPDRLVDPDRPQARHDPARRQPLQPLAARARRGGRGHREVAQARTTSASGSRRPRRGSSTTKRTRRRSEDPRSNRREAGCRAAAGVTSIRSDR